MPTDRVRRLARAAYLLSAAQLLVGVGVSATPNSEGWAGGIFYALLYAVPLALVGWMIQSPMRRRSRLAAIIALVLGVFFPVVVIGNWSGYSAWQAVFAVFITVPTALLFLVIFWTVMIRAPKEPADAASAENGS